MTIQSNYRKSNGSSSQSLPDRHHEDDGKPQQLSIYHIYSTRPTAQTSPQQRAASTHFPTDEPRFSTKSSSKTAKRIFFHRLVPSSSSCSTGMFIVTAPFFYARTAHDRDPAPDRRTTLSDSAAGRGTCSRSLQSRS